MMTVMKLVRMAENSMKLSRREEADFPNFHAASMMNDANIPHSTRPSDLLVFTCLILLLHTHSFCTAFHDVLLRAVNATELIYLLLDTFVA